MPESKVFSWEEENIEKTTQETATEEVQLRGLGPESPRKECVSVAIELSREVLVERSMKNNRYRPECENHLTASTEAKKSPSGAD